MLNKMLKFYTEHAYTDNYIMGFSFKGYIYAVHKHGTDLSTLLKVDKASRGQGLSLRYRPVKAQKIKMLFDAECVGSMDTLTAIAKAMHINKGEAFEKIITEAYGQTWHKDSLPFTEGADLTADGIDYQIKFEEATFINEGQMKRIGA